MANETRRDDQSSDSLLNQTTAATRLDAGSAVSRPTQLDVAGASQSTQREFIDRTPLAGIRVVVPVSLRERYTIQRQLPTQGAEADILVAQEEQDGRAVIIKLYRHGIKPKSEVLAKIAQIASEHVVQLYDHGRTAEGVWYEVMEHASHGSLRDIVKKPLPPPHTEAILKQLHAALAELHKHHIIHRDLKPENILVRDLLPLDLILTDFGIASVNAATQHLTNTSRTAKYAAPEAASGVVSAKADWWSLGMILLEVLTGKTPFDGMSDAVITKHLITHPVTVEGVDNTRWLSLLKGLLNRNDQHRWGDNEVSQWLAGEMPILQADLEATGGSIHFAYRPYTFAGCSYDNPKALASGLVQHWSEAVKHLSRDSILKWYQDEIKDQDTINFLIDLKEDRKLSADIKLLRVVQRLDPSLPPIWKGIDVSVDGLQAIAQAALNNDKQREWLSEFWQSARGEYSQQDFTSLISRVNVEQSVFYARWERLDQAIKQDASILMAKISLLGNAPAIPHIPAKPTESWLLPQLISICQNQEQKDLLIDDLLSKFRNLNDKCHWFAELGEIETADMATLLIMKSNLDLTIEWGKISDYCDKSIKREIDDLLGKVNNFFPEKLIKKYRDSIEFRFSEYEVKIFDGFLDKQKNELYILCKSLEKLIELSDDKDAYREQLLNKNNGIIGDNYENNFVKYLSTCLEEKIDKSAADFQVSIARLCDISQVIGRKKSLTKIYPVLLVSIIPFFYLPAAVGMMFSLFFFPSLFYYYAKFSKSEKLFNDCFLFLRLNAWDLCQNNFAESPIQKLEAFIEDKKQHNKLLIPLKECKLQALELKQLLNIWHYLINDDDRFFNKINLLKDSFG